MPFFSFPFLLLTCVDEPFIEIEEEDTTTPVRIGYNYQHFTPDTTVWADTAVGGTVVFRETLVRGIRNIQVRDLDGVPFYVIGDEYTTVERDTAIADTVRQYRSIEAVTQTMEITMVGGVYDTVIVLDTTIKESNKLIYTPDHTPYYLIHRDSGNIAFEIEGFVGQTPTKAELYKLLNIPLEKLDTVISLGKVEVIKQPYTYPTYVNLDTCLIVRIEVEFTEPYAFFNVYVSVLGKEEYFNIQRQFGFEHPINNYTMSLSGNQYVTTREIVQSLLQDKEAAIDLHGSYPYRPSGKNKSTVTVILHLPAGDHFITKQSFTFW